MTTGTLDRRTLLVLGAGLTVIVVLRFVILSDRQPAADVVVSDSVPLAEQRLAKLRETLATVPGKENSLKQAFAELAKQEKGMILADTAAQAQTQLLEILRAVGKANGIDLRGAEEMKIGPLANDYGEVSVAVSFNCRIEQFVNFLTDLANRPELIATRSIRIGTADPKEKTVTVRLELSGVTLRKLVPVKKGPGIS